MRVSESRKKMKKKINKLDSYDDFSFYQSVTSKFNADRIAFVYNYLKNKMSKDCSFRFFLTKKKHFFFKQKNKHFFFFVSFGF